MNFEMQFWWIELVVIIGIVILCLYRSWNEIDSYIHLALTFLVGVAG